MKKKDLHKIAPKLSEISLKKTGFEIPNKYFDTIEDTVFTKLKIENLQKYSTKKRFKTPENYFNSVEDIVIAKLKAEAIQIENKSTLEVPKDYFNSIDENVFTKIKSEAKIISLKNTLTKIIFPITIAASLLLIITLNTNKDLISFGSLATTDIENWIENGNIDIDDLTIASIYSDIELNNDNYALSISDEEVIDYLNNEDLELIIYEN
ncbi:MAG: hypothetical protein QM495_02340 [Lutibacter sp.]|uniref:hypothetical protein n=1 Tax=Lutibacter sp. TaxID=1925666 RepID=UPI00385BDED6